MSYETSYTHIPEGPARILAALEDTRNYIDDDMRFNTIVRAVSELTLEQAELALSFAGIQGLPATAIWQFSRGFLPTV